MADTLDITAGAGTTIATDDCAGSHYQRIKLSDGTADATGVIAADIGVKANALRVCPANDITDATYIGDIKFGEALATVTTVDTVTTLTQMGGVAITMGEGVLAAGCQRVTLATDDDGVAHLATIAGDTTNIETAIQLLDNAVDGNYLNVNLNVAGTDVSANAGVLTAQTLRVTIATDDEVNNLLGTIDTDTGVIAGDTTSIDGKITACNTGAVVLATGSAAIGKLAANTGVDIGDVDVLSLPAITLAAAQTLATVTTVGTVTTITNVVHIDDNAGAITVDGTVTAELSATDNAVLDTIDADTGAIKLATEIMDDWDATHASAAPADGAQVMGAAYSTALPTDVGADADAARLVTDRYGRLCTGLQPQAAKATLDNADTTTAREVVAATATRRIFVTSLILSVDTAGNYWLEDGDATAVTGKFYLAANGGVAVTFPEGTPLNTVTQNKALNVKGSTAGNVSVTVTYYLAV